MFSVKDMQENVLHPVEERGEIPFTSPPTKHHHLHHSRHAALSLCHFSQTLSCLTFGETKEPQERGENEGRDGTAQVGSFNTSAAHNGP